MTVNYNSDSIQSLGLLGGVRAKPASIGLESHNHTFIEILMNSIDEFRAGYGNKIIITKHEDNSISIQDFGRSLPMAKNSNGEYAYKKIFEEMWAGGKYKNNAKDNQGNYKWSCGTNGMGAMGSSITADFLEATAIAPNHKKYYVRYEKGIQVGGFEETTHDFNYTGTIIHWIPSKEVFKGDNDITKEFICEILKQQAITNDNLNFIYIDENTNEELNFYYQNGAEDYIRELDKSNTSLTDIMKISTEAEGRENKDDEIFAIKSNLTFTFNNDINLMEYYHNSSYLENGGTPQDFIKNGFTYAIDKYIYDKHMYKNKEKKISFDDIQDSLIIISDTYSTISLYTDQAKKKINSKFMKSHVSDFIKEQLHIYFIENPIQAELICNQILLNKRVREHGEVAKKNIKKKLSESNDTFGNKVAKLTDSKIHGEEAELFIAEGLSAKTSLVDARNPKIQGVYALRGKVLNCLKASYDEIFKNDVILDLIRALGCGVKVNNKRYKEFNSFNITKLKYGKVIIGVDADPDGIGSICPLILTMIYRLMPELLYQGKIYMVLTPLFNVKDSNGKIHYCYTEVEKEELIKNLKGKYTVKRVKGLGEQNADDMYITAMNPETRRMIKIEVDDAKKMIDMFELWMGTEVEPRKEYITEHLHEYFNYED